MKEEIVKEFVKQLHIDVSKATVNSSYNEVIKIERLLDGLMDSLKELNNYICANHRH